MDKTVIFAVAGSGKTSYILNELNLESRALVITYTNSNLNNLKERVIEKFHHYPANIVVVNYADFLYQFCYKPFLSFSINAKGINWEPNRNKFAKNDSRYIDDFKRLYGNRIAKFLEEKNVFEKIRQRLGKYFDVLFIDEIQDFAGHDFNLLKQLANTSIRLLFVGDFYQHTFDTSRDGNVNGTLHADYKKYRAQFQAMGITVDQTTLTKSWRCSTTVCEFITTKLGIDISSHLIETTDILLIIDPDKVAAIFHNALVIKLFYREHYKYPCFSKNWGDSKGEDRYMDVCVVLNGKSWELYQKDGLESLPPSTLNKLYVACSRARGNLLFIPEVLLKSFKLGS